MNRIKHIITFNFIFVLFLVSAAVVCGQNQSAPPIKKGQINDVKGKNRIYVDAADAAIKETLERFFSTEGGFVVVPDAKSADIVYASALKAEIKPAFGTVENRTALPQLSGGENLKSGQQKQMRSDENKYKYEVEYRKESSALVYYDKPNGERLSVWSDRSFSTVKSKEPGARLQFAQISNDYLNLAKRFLKAVRKIK